MLSTDELNEARRQKALTRVFNFSGKIMTLGEYINSKTIIRKSEYVRTHETHKRDGCYKELSTPKTEYTLWYMENGQELGVDVPKLVYDAFQIQEPEQPETKERPTRDTLREWMFRVFDNRTEEEGNAYLEMVENALVNFVGFGVRTVDPLVANAFVELGILSDKSRARQMCDMWQFVSESLS